MKKIRYFRVIPSIPERLKGLKEIAYNIRFSWNPDAIRLFQRLDPQLWEETNHNPILLLGMLNQERFNELLSDGGFLAQLDKILEELNRYMSTCDFYEYKLEKPTDFQIAYFCAEYGLTECLPIYSGGLGILAGDHLKSASDLCLPIIGVGLLYQKGYFQQYLSTDGWQQEFYSDNDFYNMPIVPVRNSDGSNLIVKIGMLDRVVKIKLWKAQVGRVSLYLLDTNIEENPNEFKNITDQLYGGDLEMRIKQEIILGIGGVRALKVLGLEPSVFHINEGHSAFAGLERIRRIIDQYSISFDAAREAVFASSIFTTHTPVPAGIDIFPQQLMQKYFSSYVKELGISFKKFMALGRQNPSDDSEPFCMAVLALKLSAYINGVSRLHGEVSRNMWRNVWSDIPLADIPITHITNGVHIPSWISYEMSTLYQRYLGPNWPVDPDNKKVWEKVERIPDTELWGTHERRRERLVAYARKHLKKQLIKRGLSAKDIDLADEVLMPDALTIGFARRFATYKRGDLIFKDPERLAKILNDPKRPVQMIIAGKAHPKDTPGKEIIKKIIHIARSEEFRHRVVFLEDYDINMARYLVQGVDVWLNTPRRPMEACGTSGMKVTPNGGLNLSVLDGWWEEGYSIENGWAIGSGEVYSDQNYQDDVESKALYSILEKDIVPLFYDRGNDNIPRGWINKMRNAMKSLIPRFNTHLMLENYIHKFYVTAARDWKTLQEDDFKKTLELSAWKKKINSNWNNINIINVYYKKNGDYLLGEHLDVTVDVEIGTLDPSDIAVDAYYGKIYSDNKFIEREITNLKHEKQLQNNVHRYKGEINCSKTGKFGFAIRIMPFHPYLTSPQSMNLIKWG